LFIGRTDPWTANTLWTKPPLLIGGRGGIEAGAVVFSIDGRLLGMALPAPDGIALVTPGGPRCGRDRVARDRGQRAVNSPPRDVRRRELGGPDPIDRRLGSPPPSPLIWLLSLLRTRSALGLAPSLTPAVIFLPVGALFGPSALGLISPRLIARLDFAVTIALAVLGVLVGVALGREIRSAARLFVAASLESAMTIAVVAGATAYFVVSTGAPIGAPVAAFALALGLCASASSATSAHPDSEPVAAVATVSPISTTCCRS
jgi:hypothetical protein